MDSNHGSNWNCLVCTYENQSEHLCCGMCRAERAQDSPAFVENSPPRSNLNHSLSQDELYARNLQKQEDNKAIGALAGIPAAFLGGGPFSNCASCAAPMRGAGVQVSGGATFHKNCFRCTACSKLIDQSTFKLEEGFEAYHVDCYRELFHPRCGVCSEQLPELDGSIVYKYSPFWKFKYCARHEDAARCCSCQRFESRSNPFSVLSDGRSLCNDCCTTVVLDTSECEPVIKDVWQFLSSVGMDIQLHIPVLLVDYATLNQHNRTSIHTHQQHNNIVTRGLCISEAGQIKHMVRRRGNDVLEPYYIEETRDVTAILILHGLPFELTGQILAHEATHAWIRLRPNMPNVLPAQVEEGICQLMSYLWLKHRKTFEEDVYVESANEKLGVQYGRKLRDYYIHQLENDPSHVYGEGFRLALAAFEKYQLQGLLDYVASNGKFPRVE